MGFHHEHTHGRVFHGIEARDMLEHEKRDSHGDRIKLNVPVDDNKNRFIHLAGKQVADAPVITVTSQVYVTEPQTFSGPAIYITQTGAPPATTTAVVPVTSAAIDPAAASYLSAKSAQNSPSFQTSAPINSAAASYLSAKSAQNSPINSAAASYLSAKSVQHSQGHITTSAVVSSSAVTSAVGGKPLTTSRASGGRVVGQPLSATRNSSAEISEQSHGMTSGAKAGLAFGIIIALALCAGLVFFCWRRRKNHNNNHEQLYDEKHATKDSFFGGTAAAVGSSAGDRASVQSEKSVSSMRSASTAPRLSLRPVTQFLPNIMERSKTANNAALDGPQMSEKPKQLNPFSDAAMVAGSQALSTSTPANPFDEGDATANKAATAAPGEVGTAAAGAVAAAGAGPRGPNNVHRVQLDFKPSMDDELELRSGQLVRMLHEYDDGWTLCIRMDRSQQGVCPRTCLSKLPIKPRPQGPPGQQGARPRPQGPPSSAPRASPPQKDMVPRPLTPTGRERSQTVGRCSPPTSATTSRSRSQSSAGAERPVSPITTGVPARKPVPGQAI